MRRIDMDISRFLVAGLMTFSAGNVMASESEVTPNQVIDAMEGVFGVTPGERRNHLWQTSCCHWSLLTRRWQS